MSQENVEMVRRGLEEFNRGNLDAALADADAALEWHDQPELPGATVYYGLEATAEHLRSARRDLPGYRIDAEELLDAGDAVVACGRISARGRSSQIPVDRPYFAVYTIDDGRIRSIKIFGTRAEALEAVGLSE